MKRYGGQSRRALYDQVERDTLIPLPACEFEYAEWSQTKVHLDYHVQVDHHYYSVPYELVHEHVTVRLTATTVEILHNHRLVATLPRSAKKYSHTTTSAHMPPNHRSWAEADPVGVLEWARSVGPMTVAMILQTLKSRPVKQQGLRSALGLRRVGKCYGPDRTESTCKLALGFGAKSYKPVARILKLGRETPPESSKARTPIEHENVCGLESFN